MIPSVTVAAQDKTIVRGQSFTLALLVAGYSGYYLCRSNLSVAMPLLVAELGARGINPDVARITLGSIASLGVLAYAVGKVPSGTLADFLGGRSNFLFGMLGTILFTLLFAMTGIVPVFTIAWIGNRLTQSLGWAGAVKIVSKWFSSGRYGGAMGVLSLSYLFGDALARLFMGFLISLGLGWRGIFVAGAITLALLWLASFFLLRESPADLAVPGTVKRLVDDSPGDRPRSLSGLLLPFLSNPVFWLACGLSLGLTIPKETFALWTPTYFTQSAGMTAADAAASSSWFSLLGGLSVIACGWSSDRLGRGGRAALLVVGLLLASGALFALGQGTNFPVLLVALVAFLIIGPYSFLAGAISLDFGGRKAGGTASGLIDGVGYLGGVLSGDSMARVSVAYGWNRAFLLLAAVSLLSGLVAIAFWLRERRRA